MRAFNRRKQSFIRLDISGVTSVLQIREYYAERGDVHEFVFTRDTPRAEYTNLVAYIEGAVEISRSDSPDVIRRVESAGNTSNEYVWEMAPRGKQVHKVITDTYRYYCIADCWSRKMTSRTLRFPESGNEALTTGVLVFIAMGSVVVNGVRLTAPAIFEVTTPTTLFGEAGALVLEIEKLT